MDDRRRVRPPGMTIRFSEEERQALEQLAEKRHTSMAWVVRHLVRQAAQAAALEQTQD